ncbi:MAG: hypothetical protein A3A96_01465 [Candidatus Zambryskibacteria bacterium RIFCSPLOWO2_01_FULL_39_39]|uniref:Uncharacterized protein n=2 Tax=Patescibacteria group TaxID=1783273 RepID=A0A1G2TZQ0_9BACT|nr:MAG: hypothetical protein UT61_C0019G0006 [Candidatus Woesebacteria bacterium GW2011_GWA1_39_8]OHA86670.1 MAG: hypothetical protein A2644_03155 [Candidatus Zambryskibacteria bacterium RIFCSPHIGHO2_01_FULL_39_63]OHA95243.1 MAG: hypothetical protein A3B88_02920 [Candidatus Zambryskibacteria bacterium RIFCSPHIGHO2_02_FULL_39_19]OHA98838.1 MAG: hypothetical protein A3F20_02195 [Candidatus Zambryskibacteria bacterium RIFCSPHIGHO2_12_FULL_39_21]OHB02791.1 MAG: hypothetical protein A3A96_01465 [Can
MDKKIIYGIIIVVFIVGLSSFFLKSPFNLSGDPFGASPKGTSPNCGPEDRYKFDVAINSKEDFINFLKTSEGKILDQYGNNWLKLDNFKDKPGGDVNWDKVLSSVDTENIGGKTLYVLNYNPGTCSGFKLKMTGDGHVSNYGCCGI